MKLNFNKTLAISLVSTASLLFGCVDNEKDLYDPTQRAKNPMGEIVAPEGFDWTITSTLKVNVEAGDEYDAQYFYQIEILNANPLETENYEVLTKGVAKLGSTYATEIVVTPDIQTVYIRQIDPRGRDKIQQFNIADSKGVINCTFQKAPTINSRSLAVSTRAREEGVTVPQLPSFTEQQYDISLAKKITSSNDVLQSGKEYIIEGNYSGNINTTNISSDKRPVVYIKGTWTPTDWSSQGNAHIIVLGGGKISAKNFTMNTGMDLTIQSGATVTGNGGWNSSEGITIINFGTFTVTAEAQYQSFSLNSGSTLFNGASGSINATRISCLGGRINNEGSIKTREDIVLNTNVILYNHKGKKIEAKNLNSQSGGDIYNFGDIDIENTITSNTNSILYNGAEGLIKGNKYTASGSTNINYGTMELDYYDNGNAGGAKLYNYCALLVDEELKIGGLIYMNHGVIADEKNDDNSFDGANNISFYNNAIVTLANGSMIKGERIVTGTDLIIEGVKNNNTSLLKATEVFEIRAGAPLTFKGNLAISGKIKVFSGSYNAIDGVVMAEKPDVIITGCNGSSEPVDPGTPPTNPDFPIIVEPNEKYSLMFEDQWPFYGDYDMNDIVFDLKGLKYSLDEKNETDEVSFIVTLQAVGALKTIAAAVMLDKINATQIASIEYGNVARPHTFDVTANGIEKNQQLAVIPLFDDAHQLMGKKDGVFINTQPGSKDNVGENDYPEIELTIKLKNKVSKSYFNINNMNFFIIVDKAAKRKEVHMAGYKPSNLANTQLFGMNDDNSSGSKYYVSKEGLAWGIIVPQQFKWPLEYNNVKDVYEEFEGWIVSGGTKNKNWYNSFDNTKIFQNNKN